MQTISSAKWSEWKRKRRSSFVGFIIVAFIVGMDYSFMLSTLYLYLRDLIKVDQPAVYYGVIICAFNVSSSICGIICGRWVDKYRKIKLYTNFVLIMQIIGGILYVIPCSVVCPLVGRLIVGVGDPFGSVITGEIIRSNNQEDGTSAVGWLSAVYSFGLMIGPVVVLFFKNTDFYILDLHFTQLNAVGIPIVGILFVAMVIINFLIHDCSAMIDLKTYLKDNKTLEGYVKANITPDIRQNVNEPNREVPGGGNDINKVSEDTPLLPFAVNKAVKGYLKKTVGLGEEMNTEDKDDGNSVNKCISDGGGIHFSNSSSKTKPIRLIIFRLLKDVDAVLMLVSTIVFAYSVLSIDVLLPVLNVIILDWTLTDFSVIYIAHGIMFLIMITVISKFCVTNRAFFYLFMITIPCIILVYIDIIFLQYLKNNLIQDVVMMIALIIFWSAGWLIQGLLIRCTLAKMVPSHCQSFTEAIRNGLSRVGYTLASLTTAIAMPHLTWWCAGVIVINVAVFIAFIWRRKHLLFISEIEFKHYYSR